MYLKSGMVMSSALGKRKNTGQESSEKKARPSPVDNMIQWKLVKEMATVDNTESFMDRLIFATVPGEIATGTHVIFPGTIDKLPNQGEHPSDTTFPRQARLQMLQSLCKDVKGKEVCAVIKDEKLLELMLEDLLHWHRTNISLGLIKPADKLPYKIPGMLLLGTREYDDEHFYIGPMDAWEEDNPLHKSELLKGYRELFDKCAMFGWACQLIRNLMVHDFVIEQQDNRTEPEHYEMVDTDRIKEAADLGDWVVAPISKVKISAAILQEEDDLVIDEVTGEKRTSDINKDDDCSSDSFDRRRALVYGKPVMKKQRMASTLIYLPKPSVLSSKSIKTQSFPTLSPQPVLDRDLFTHIRPEEHTGANQIPVLPTPGEWSDLPHRCSFVSVEGTLCEQVQFRCTQEIDCIPGFVESHSDEEGEYWVPMAASEIEAKCLANRTNLSKAKLQILRSKALFFCAWYQYANQHIVQLLDPIRKRRAAFYGITTSSTTNTTVTTTTSSSSSTTTITTPTTAPTNTTPTIIPPPPTVPQQPTQVQVAVQPIVLDPKRPMYSIVREYFLVKMGNPTKPQVSEQAVNPPKLTGIAIVQRLLSLTENAIRLAVSEHYLAALANQELFWSTKNASLFSERFTSQATNDQQLTLLLEQRRAVGEEDIVAADIPRYYAKSKRATMMRWRPLDMVVAAKLAGVNCIVQIPSEDNSIAWSTTEAYWDPAIVQAWWFQFDNTTGLYQLVFPVLPDIV